MGYPYFQTPRESPSSVFAWSFPTFFPGFLQGSRGYRGVYRPWVSTSSVNQSRATTHGLPVIFSIKMWHATSAAQALDRYAKRPSHHVVLTTRAKWIQMDWRIETSWRVGHPSEKNMTVFKEHQSAFRNGSWRYPWEQNHLPKWLVHCSPRLHDTGHAPSWPDL